MEWFVFGLMAFICIWGLIRSIFFSPTKIRSVLALRHNTLIHIVKAIQIDNTWYIFIKEKDEDIHIYIGICGDSLEEDDRICKGCYWVKKVDRGFWKMLLALSQVDKGNYGRYYISFEHAQ